MPTGKGRCRRSSHCYIQIYGKPTQSYIYIYMCLQKRLYMHRLHEAIGGCRRLLRTHEGQRICSTSANNKNNNSGITTLRRKVDGSDAQIVPGRWQQQQAADRHSSIRVFDTSVYVYWLIHTYKYTYFLYVCVCVRFWLAVLKIAAMDYLLLQCRCRVVAWCAAAYAQL